jgi:DNA-binding transcriptional LysR family regulator
LRVVLAGCGSPRRGLYLVYPSADHLSAAVRALIDHFVASFGNGAIAARLEKDQLAS